MFSISLINTLSGALLSGLKEGQRIDTSTLDDQAIRIIPAAGTGIDPLEVKGIRLVLTDAEGATTTLTDSSAPFVFDSLPVLASGTTSLTIDALDAEGAALDGGSQQIDFIAADGPEVVPPVFEALKVQAEDIDDSDSDGNFATLSPDGSGLAVVSGDPNGVNAEGGAYVDYGAATGETLTFTVNVPEAGEYELALSYALSQNNNGTDRNRPLRLEVNEQLVDRTFDLPSTTDTADAGDFTTFAERTIRVSLEEGQNTVSFTSNGASGPNVDYLEVRKPALGSLVIQGEDLTLSPTPDLTSQGSDTNRPITVDNIASVDDTFRVGAEGASYLDWAYGNADAYGEFIFEAPVAGTYSITVTYAGSSDRPLDLFLVEEGTPIDIGTFAFTATTAPESLPDDLDDIPETVDLPTAPSPWEGWTTETLEISLGAGESLLRLGGRANGPNIDKIEMALVSADPVAPTAISLDNDSVLENDAGAAIGQLSVEDLDDSTHSFTVDDARFEVDANGVLRLKSGESLDFETEQSVTLNVTATDSTEASTSETFIIAVGDVQDEIVEPPSGFEPIVIQAEAGELGENNDPGTLVRDADNPEDGTGFQGLRPDYSGTGYLDFGSKPGDVVTFTVEVIEAGSYDLNVRYASNGDRPLDLSVNDGAASGLAFPGTDPDGAGELEGFDNWEYATVPVTLNAGENTIALAIPAGANKGPNLDRVEITESGSGPIGDVTADDGNDLVLSVQETLVNADAAGALGFTLAGVDDDIASIEISFDEGETRQSVTPGEDGSFTLDVSGLEDGPNNATVYLLDAAGNRATTATGFTLDTSADSDANLALAGPAEAVAVGATAVAFDVTGLDADIETLEVSLDGGETRQAVSAVDGTLTLDLSALPAGAAMVLLYATDAAGNQASANASISLEDASAGPLDIIFDNVTSYTTTQDRPVNAPGYVVSEDGASLALNDNLWKRVGLPQEYTLTEQTRIVLDLAIGENDPEIVAVGFDLDENAFDGDRSIYQLGGTQDQGAFIDLRGSGVDNGDGTARFTIDLSDHAGVSIDSLVFISDDDATAVLGSATFSNVQLVENAGGGDENSAPRVVGGGIADLQIDENGLLEVDLPFVDDDGDALSYSFALSQAGMPVEGFDGLAIEGGVLSGSLVGLEAGTYTVTVTADDGSVTTDTAFELTINNVNEAPVAEDVALEPYFGELGSFFDGIELASFAVYFSDPDGDALTLSVEGLPEGLSVDEEGVISGKPSEAGSFDVVIRATDAEGLSDTLTLQFQIEEPGIGDSVNVEAEAFTGLAEADNFFVTGNANASGNQIIRLANGQTETQVSTELADNGVVPGWYSVSVVVFDETDGQGTLSLQVGDSVLQARNTASDTLTGTVVLNDNFGVLLNDGLRGSAAQAGNLKQIAFETPVYVDEATLATLTAQGESGELMRLDRLVFTRIEEPVNEAPTITGLASTIAIDENTSDVATLILADAEDDALSVTLEGVDAALFDFDPASGALTFVTAPDAEAPTDADGDGQYELTVSVSDGENVTTQDVVVSVNDLDETPFSPITLQAEDATLTVLDDGSNSTVTTIRDPDNPEDNDNLPNGLRPGFSGTGYLDFGDTAGDAVTFDVTVAQAGTYDLNIRYASNTARPLDLSIDGGSVGQLPFVSTDPDGSGPEEGFDHWLFETVTVTLEAGSNSLSLAIPEGANTGPNIDRIEITEAGTGPIPVDDSADEDGNLTLSADDATLEPGEAANVGFSVAGIDDDIQTVEISFDGGATRTPVTPDANGDFSADLSALSGNVTATVIVTDAAGNEASAATELTIGEAPVDVDPITIQAEDASLVQINDSGVPTSGDFTRVVDAANPDAFGNYREGGIGGAYVDFGTNPGDEVVFNVDAEVAGTYTATIRFANGGNEARPLGLSVNGGSSSLVAFPATPDDGANEPWAVWNELEVEVDLEAGSNQVAFAIPTAAEGGVDNGPNLDQIVFAYNDDTPEEPTPEPGERFKVKINFQPDGFATPDGYVADTGLAFGEQSVEVDGQTYQYGWVSEASIADGTENGTTPMAIADQSSVAVNDRTDDIAGLDPRQGTYAHFDQPAPGYERAGWEIELEDGFYEVTISIGDTSGPYDSNNVLNAEGELFNDPFTPFRPDDFPADGNPADDTEGFRSDLVTRVVQVTDGRLTLDSIGLDNENTEIQYIEIQALPDLTPDDDRDAPADYAFFTDPRAIAGVGENEVEVDLDPADGSAPTGVDPTSDIFLGISVVDGRGGALLESLQDGSVRLFETVSGEEVAFNVNTTGGFDSLTISPTGGLKEYTSYTLVVDGFRDRGDNENPDAPTREFQKFTSTFVTGEAPEIVAREVAFNDVVELDGAADGAFGMTSLELSPDGSKMYVTSMGGEIKRYDVDPVTGALSGEQTLALDHFQGSGGPRGIIGVVFDPTDPNVLWVSDNYPIPLSGRDNGVPDFSGRITKLTLGEGDDFTATAETYVTGLPRSNGDHVTNSLEFRANPDYDPDTNPDVPTHLLYVVQGSNSAMGEADSAWGLRPERLLNANVLEIDPTREAPEGGFDVSTEPLPGDGLNRRFADSDEYPKNAPIPMGDGEFLVFAENGTATVQDGDGNILESFYDPFADDAVVKIFATGVRNAYDLVWHSNGHMYVPTNGSAAGGSVPDDPSTPVDEKRTGVEKQDDYLFKVEEGGYYGHPNPLRDEYILNGGNPTAGNDTNQVGNYPAGTDPDPNYRLDDAYSLGENRSPNGATEYTSGVFGGNLQGNVLFTEYSGGDDIRSITLDADGNVIGDDVLRDVNGNVITYVDPLDIIENPATGQLYLLTLNRGNGQSQLVRLDPAPGGVVDPGDGGGDGGDDNGDLVSLLTIQAEDATPDDGTSVTVASGADAEIEIRTVDNPESNPSLQPLGLRPGSFGVDGNTDDTDGSPGGYADFGSTNADFLTFNFELSADQAGESVLQVRYANGAATNRPLEVFVNNVSVGTFAFAPPSDVTGDEAWNTWQTLDIPAELISGQNTVRFQATAATGPNIDQLEILQEPADTTPGYAEYEAESAQLDGPVVVPASEDDRNASGDGFVDFDGTVDQSITWSVEVAEAGTYEIGIRYALAASKADRPLDLTINGSPIGSLNFPGQSNAAEDDWFYQTTTVTLNAGSNTVSVTAPGANGPNIDLLRVADEPLDTFEPTYAEVSGETRIELESGDTARAVNAKTADFYFTVDQDGAYKLDLAANAGASDGGQLTLTLNGQPLDELSFPGVGDDGEESAFVELEAGISYNLRVVSSADGAEDIDYLDVSPAPGDPDADIGIQSGDAAYFSDRLHFSYLENNSVSNDDRDFKESGSVVISNTGSAELSILDADVVGPFELADPDIFSGLTLAAGESITVEILFDRDAYTPPANDAGDGVFEGTLRLVTNDADTPVAEVHLAGFWQARDEGGWEPNINEVWEVFGFGNVIEGLATVGGGQDSVLNDFDLYRPVNDDEVLSRYWKIADGFESAKITQIAAFHGDGGASLGIHNPGNKGQDITLSNHAGDNNQSILPIKSNGQFATATITKDLIPDGWLGNDLFGIEVAGLSTDPSLNPSGGGSVPPGAEGIERGYTVRMFQALDADGNVIPNTYLGVMDYTGINYDYNDNMFVIEGVEPASGGEISIENLDGVPSDDRLVMSRIENPASSSQEVHDEVTFTISNDGFADLEIASLDIADPSLFEIVGDSTDLVIPAGGSLNVTVRFIASDSNAGSLYESTLTINSNDGDEGQKVIQLAGIAQGQSESGQEPTVQEIVNAFGFTTNVAEGEMNKGGLVEANGDEILSPYFQRADGGEPVKITQLAAYHGQGDIARLFIHDVDSRDVDEILAHDEQDGQTLLPRALDAGDQLTTTTLDRDDPFGFFAEISDRQGYISWSDPDANLYEDTVDEIGAPGNDLGWDANDGHLIRVYVAKDGEGNVIPDTYIVIQDYAGVNYDYNDNIFLVENVQTYDPTGAEDADGNGRVDLYDDDDGDGTPNFLDDDVPATQQTAFNETETPWAVGADGLSLEAKLFDNGGQDVAYNDTTSSHQGASFRGDEAVDISNGTEALGYIADGEWVEYTLDVETAGTYALNFLTSAVAGGRSITAAFEQNGSFYESGSIGLPNTGSFTTFQNVGPLEFELEAGVQTLRLTFNGGTLDLQSFDLAAAVAENNAPVVDAGLADLTASEDEAFSFAIPTEAFSDADGDTLSYTASGLPAGLTISPAGVISGTPTAPGSYDILVTASDGSASVDSGFTLTVEADAGGGDEQSAFNAAGTPWAVGDGLTLDATLYDEGGQDIAYNDSSETQLGSDFRGEGVDIVGNGDAIGWVEDGEWVEYTINVAEAGTYDLSFLSALGTQGGGARSITASFAQGGGVYETASSVGVDYSGGWSNFQQTGSTQVELEAGEQVLRLTFNGGSQDLASFTLAPVETNSAPTVDAGLADLSATADEAFSFTIPAEAFADADGDALTYTASGLPNGLSITPAGVISGTPTAAGSFDILVSASDGSASVETGFTLNVEAAPVEDGQSAFNATGTPWAVGDSLTLEAALFDEGGQDVAYNDSSATKLGDSFRDEGVDTVGDGRAIGYVEDGEWVEYTINVEQAGTYSLSFMTAAKSGGRTITASVEQGDNVYATSEPMDAGVSGDWTTYIPTPALELDLQAGEQVLRLTFNGGSMDLQSWTLEQGGGDGQQAFNDTGTPWLVDEDGLSLDAVLFDKGGQDVAYNDSSEVQRGDDFREDGVDVVGNGEAIGYVEDGEWVEYTINVEQAGTYSLSFETATPDDGRTITAAVEQGGAFYATSEPLAVPNSGDWGNYVATQTLELDLQAGEQVLRLTFNGGEMDLKSLNIEQQTGVAPLQSLALDETSFVEETAPAANDDVVPMSDGVSLAGLEVDATEDYML